MPLCPYRVPHATVAHTLANVLFVTFSLQTYGAKVDQIRADFGTTASLVELEKALQSKKYKLVTVTHVDTSTGALRFLVHLRNIAFNANSFSCPFGSESCSSGGEESLA